MFDFQHKRCVGSKTIKSASSGVVCFYNSGVDMLLGTVAVGSFVLQLIVLGDCRWYLCSTCEVAVFARYSGCCCNFFFKNCTTHLIRS